MLESALFLALLLPAAEDPPAPPPKACTGPEHRQFDFWVGRWEVYRPDGQLAGTNRIEPILDGCVLRENWRSASGSSIGRSFNVFARGQWRQTWVDNSGLFLELAGGLDGKGRMVMSQDRTDKDGRTVRHVITWTPRPDGTVRQHWQITKDGGRTFQALFDGIYRRVEPPVPPGAPSFRPDHRSVSHP